ncbi:roadblock/LC7 domain-containing protein [Streptomyces sp. NPDC002730]|uniref:roadblock/LC7 domain-containing protein n=1 Tax=Streptomyces sp. NPDC002730 TaxID=3364662 RepID=UPI0036B1AD4C
MTTDPDHAPAIPSQLDLLLTGLVQQVSHARHALVVSEDGLVVSKSTAFPRPESERLAAAVSGLISLGRSTCADFNGGAVLQTLIEMRDGFLIVTSAGVGAHLAVLTTAQVDVGVTAFEMNMLVKKIGKFLSAAPRVEPAIPHESRDARTT